MKIRSPPAFTYVMGPKRGSCAVPMFIPSTRATDAEKEITPVEAIPITIPTDADDDWLQNFDSQSPGQPEGSAGAVHSATIQAGSGMWEITSLSVIIGGSTIIATTVPLFGTGEVRYEDKDQTSGTLTAQKHAMRLMHGRCSLLIPMIMEGSKVVIGPGQIKSYIEQRYANEHTLTATYRRVKD